MVGCTNTVNEVSMLFPQTHMSLLGIQLQLKPCHLQQPTTCQPSVVASCQELDVVSHAWSALNAQNQTLT